MTEQPISRAEFEALTGRVQAIEDELQIDPPPDPDPIPDPPRKGWNSGVWAEHNRTQAEEWFKWIGRGPGQTRRHVTAFVTHAASEGHMTSSWWATCIPPDTGLSLRVPLVPKGDQDWKKDRSATFRTIARQAANIDPHALICPGWEYNLPGWAHAITPQNAVLWRTNWQRCYDAMKAEAPGLVIGLNPNGGDMGQTGVDVRKAYVQGYVDAIGPDQYDCWPGMLDDATTHTMFNRPGGLQWWANFAEIERLKFIVPEWGVSSGSQWKGHTGNDNPRYIREMFDFFSSTPGLYAESYFNGSYSDLRGDIFRSGGAPSANPKSAVAYAALARLAATPIG